MCCDPRREGIKYQIGNVVPFARRGGIEEYAPLLGHVRSETMGKILSNPKIHSWEEVDLPFTSFSERTQGHKDTLVPFDVPEGLVVGGVLIKNDRSPKGQLAILTRPTTQGEYTSAQERGFPTLNNRMPVIREPL